MLVPCDNEIYRTENGHHLLFPTENGFGIYVIDLPVMPYLRCDNNYIFNNYYYKFLFSVKCREIGFEVLKLLEKDEVMAKELANFNNTEQVETLDDVVNRGC